ncbi:MAG TPA: RES family NAD+ phosphorylase [Acidobacteriota bacterium]
MPLSLPPEDAEDLRSFPQPEPLVGPGRPDLFRIFRHRDPETGQTRGPFHFASCPGANDAPGGRYDLPAPAGACYLALSPIGAWLEVFRTTRIVASDDVRRRRLLATRPPRRIRTADLLAKKARAYGVTGEIHTHDDHSLPRAWAMRLHEAGFRALLGKVRHDPGLHERSLTLLDVAGEHEPYGWRWHADARPLHDAGELLSRVQEYGYRVLTPPHDVVTDEMGR